MTSSTSAGSSCGTFASAAFTICTVRSSGRMLIMLPLKARPIGERAVATMTASGMAGSLAELVVYRTVAHDREAVSRRQAGRRAAGAGVAREPPHHGGGVPLPRARQVARVLPRAVVEPRRGLGDRQVEIVAALGEQHREVPADGLVQVVPERPVDPREDRLVQP